jgi:hypothetical protein
MSSALLAGQWLSGSVMQAAYVVEDIQQAMAHWTRVLRVGPFFHFQHFPILEVMHRGNPAPVDIDVALAFSGSMCFELIQQHDRSPSVFREQVDSRGYGFHHWGVATRTFDADLARAERDRTPLVASCVVAIGARTAYLDSIVTLGALVELMEMTPEVEGLFGAMHAASVGWDGTDPVRTPAL